jgi:hypothetical protein
VEREKLAGLADQRQELIRQEFDEAVPKPALEVKKEKAKSKPAEQTAGRLELLSEEKNFLEFVFQHPGMFVTKIYQALSLSGYKGDRLKESLIEKGLLVQEETRDGRGGRLAKILALADKGADLAKKLLPKGKGGDLHKDLQRMIKEQAEVFGWQAVIEERIGRSLESVDVGLRKNDMKAAVEVCDTTRPEQEIQNIRKCLEAGYDYIVSVCSDDKQLALLKTEVKKSFSFKERERIRFYPVSRVKNFFSSIGSAAIVSEKPQERGFAEVA